METHHLEARPLDLVLSQHPEHALRFTGGRCCSWPATESHLTIIGFRVVEKVLLVIEVSLSRGRWSAKPGRRRGREGCKRFCEGYRSAVVMATREHSFGAYEAEKCLPREEQLWGSWICKSEEIWSKATGFTFYILVWGSINRSRYPGKYSNVPGYSILWHQRYLIHIALFKFYFICYCVW